ncbi:glutathione S-transferase family protein [Paracoccus sp. MBLB3053]|uniref:Glutathione S-transferase family protein n=1 Tax=Paracoccus aurantius TaxID=3073814 RepID=A0ABU2HTT4_9RHOB|nr:glutathione S-transferase family protein [Paracoccus sp. MBLB3053]MDS9468456.1 glutathione S-transferase family protein [Paracoccus sp. MBLB3053]
MLTIYGVTRSRASRIIWLCHELGLPFRQVPVIQAYRLSDPDAADAPQNTRSESFLKLSPAGAIPVIRDGDLVLSESLACTLHLARKHGQPFGPANETEDALMLQWSFYAAASVEQDALTILFLHRPGQAQSGADQASVANAAERLIRPLAVLEDHLSRNGYLVAGRFTVADINVAEILRYAQSHHELLDRFPAVTAWLKDCQSRPAFMQMWRERLAEPE